MSYQKNLAFIINRRKEELAKARLLYLDLLSKDSALFALDKAYRESCLDFSQGADERAKINRKKIVAYLKKSGYYSSIYPAPRCSQCLDTGYALNKLCDCVKQLSIKSENIEMPLRSFSESDPTLFGANEPIIRSTQTILEGICEKFPQNKLKNIVLMGKTGTGKTFLASCVADALVKKDKSVMFVSAFDLNVRLLKHHTSFDNERLSHIEPLIDCDMLVIDDLGSESIYKNVTVELFYHVINERYNRGKSTLITTNLTLDEMTSRYGERTCSRLFDKRLCFAREFDFADNRKIKL